MEPLGRSNSHPETNPLKVFGFGPDFFKGAADQARAPIQSLLGTPGQRTYLPEYNASPTTRFENLPEYKPQSYTPGGNFSLLDSPFAKQLQGSPLAGLFPQVQGFFQTPHTTTTQSVLPQSPSSPSRETRGGWLPKYTDAGLVTKVQQRKAAIAAGIEAPPSRATTSGDLVAGEEEFNNPQLEQAFAAVGLAGLTDAACGPIAIAGLLRAFGINATAANVALDSYNAGEWKADGMQRGNGDGIAAMLTKEGLASTNTPIGSPGAQDDLIALVSAGTPVVLNFPTHYMLAQAYDAATGKFFVGATGSNALRGGSDWMTLQEMNQIAGNGGALESFIAPNETSVSPTSTSGYPTSATPADPNATPQQVEAYARESARQRGIDPNVAVRVILGEGGFEVAKRGTFATGSSWWPLQLHYGGQGYEQFGSTAGLGNDFTAQTGFQPGDPRAWAASIDFALNNAAANRSWQPWYGRKWYNVGVSEGFGPNTRPV